MNIVWTLTKKELRLLVRDRLAALLLLVMPLLFILVLGLLLGEGFGQKPDDRMRVFLVDHDTGPCLLEGYDTWAEVVRADLAETPGIKVEIIATEDEASRLIAEHKLAAVLIFKPDFSRQMNQCSFMVDGINPFHREGVYLDKVGAALLKDSKQPGTASIIEQVAQVTLLRVILPWMIGQAFERLSDPAFIQLLGEEVNLPVPSRFQLFIGGKPRITLGEMLTMAANSTADEAKYRRAAGGALGSPTPLVLNYAAGMEFKGKVGGGVQGALATQFQKYKLTGKTWAKLTRAQESAVVPPETAAAATALAGALDGDGPFLACATVVQGTTLKDPEGAQAESYMNRDGSGVLKRGAQRYQVLVPSYTVMFAFFLVLNVGWVFVSERRQGTLKRLRAAPVTRGQILLGKLIPCYALSVSQGFFLLVAGRLLFGMRWGPADWTWYEQVAWLTPVVLSTSLAAMGLALLVASISRTEMQVALYGAVPVLVLALIGGCVLPREMMPESTQGLSLLTPHGWSLNAYRELLDTEYTTPPNLAIVVRSCGVLTGFGLTFLGLAWAFLRLD
jgi:ABC-2 type transport system permease protein